MLLLMQKLKFFVIYFYLITQILKIWYIVKRFAESQNVTKTWQFFLTIYSTKKNSHIYFFLISFKV